MPSIKRKWMLVLELLLLVGVVAWVGVSLLAHPESKPDDAVSLKIPMRAAHEQVHLHRLEDGSYRYRVISQSNHVTDLTPDAFAQRVYSDQKSRGLLSVVLNITSPWGIIWVGLGLLGQVLFTGRMVVQWLISEKNHQSVVPPSFWWMSLAGASMLLIYFLWRKDAVGVLGQSAGWFIYLRNLWMIYNPRPTVAETTAIPATVSTTTTSES